MRLSLGFPDRVAERSLLQGERQGAEAFAPVLSPADLLDLQRQADRQHCSPALLDYVLDLLEHSRAPVAEGHSLSPRAGLALLAAARAWSLLEGRDHVRPDDVQQVLAAVCEHRLDGGRPVGPGSPRSQALLSAVRALR